MGTFRIAVLASGTGTNLQAILDGLHGRDGIEVVCVASNKPGARPWSAPRTPGWRRACSPARTTATGSSGTPRWPTGSSREGGGADRARRLHGAAVGRVRAAASQPDRQRSPGAAVLVPRPRRGRAGPDARRRVTGVTVHFVDEGVDSGPIILQRAIEVPYTRDRVATGKGDPRVEHQLLPGGDPPDRRRGGRHRRGESATRPCRAPGERQWLIRHDRRGPRTPPPRGGGDHGCAGR